MSSMGPLRVHTFPQHVHYHPYGFGAWDLPTPCYLPPIARCHNPHHAAMLQQESSHTDHLMENILIQLSRAFAADLDEEKKETNDEQKPCRRPIEVKDEKDRLQILFDVSQYKPEELSVKSVERALVIEGKHEEKDENGEIQIKRQFSRQFRLPKDVDPQTVVSTLSKDGVLIVEAPKKALPPVENVIAIKQLEEQQAAVEQPKQNETEQQ